MRNRLAWIGGAAGGVAFVRLLRGRRRRSRPNEDAPAVDPRAEELRRKLDESRTLVDEREEFEAAETPVDEAEAPPLDERRRRVHEQARAASERMRGSRED
jgi:hypothetical protein